MDRSNVDWTPCLEVGHHNISVGALQAASGRATRTALRRRRINEARDANTITSSSGLDGTDPGPKTTQVQTENVINQSKVVQTGSHDVRCQEVQTDGGDFFSETRFSSDDAKVHYYIGLPSAKMLKLVFEFVLGSFSSGENRAFYWKSLVIVLLKLKLNLGFQDIAYRLGVSVSTVSWRFHETLDLMTTRLE